MGAAAHRRRCIVQPMDARRQAERASKAPRCRGRRRSCRAVQQLVAALLRATLSPTLPVGEAAKKLLFPCGCALQGGRVYDSETGTTCHQCRQKTVETKAKCTACTLYFCPKCVAERRGGGAAPRLAS